MGAEGVGDVPASDAVAYVLMAERRSGSGKVHPRNQLQVFVFLFDCDTFLDGLAENFAVRRIPLQLQ